MTVTAEDGDEDTFENDEEWVAMTDPTDSNDYFRVTYVTHASPVMVHFDSSSERMYLLQGATNLMEGVWTNVPGAGPRMGAGGADALEDTNDPPAGPFYRMEVELP
jgi:hypothetical protein